MKTRQDNDMTNRIGAVYVKSDTELLWSTESGGVCDENKRGQRHD